MKKIISVILILTMLLSSTTIFAQGIEDDVMDFLKGIGDGVVDITKDFLKAIINDVSKMFSDFKADSWYSEVMARLSYLGGINGYPDGTVKPNGIITKGEFVKMLVGTLGHEVDTTKKVSPWARPWVDKATELGIIPSHVASFDFKDTQLNEAISRDLAALLVRNSVREYSQEEQQRVKNYENYEKNLSDIWKSSYKKELLEAYALGLIEGYTEDNTYRPQNNLTRAEASAVIIRAIDPEMRKINEPLGKVVYSDNPEVQYINELAKRYPDNSILDGIYNFQYNATKKPGKNNDIVLLVVKVPAITTKERDYSIVLFDNHTDKDKEVLKEVLKDLFPTSYEKVYKQAITTIGKKPNAEDVVEKHDNRNTRYIRDNGSIHLIINLIGK